MIALIQRVTQATVTVNNQKIGSINQGILALIGIEKNDTDQKANKLIKKLLGYRIFADHNGYMNLNITQVNGGLLLVPQFTLAADTNSGLRPSFSEAAPPDFAHKIFKNLTSKTKAQYNNIETGQFGANMQVSLINDGPVTFWLQV